MRKTLWEMLVDRCHKTGAASPAVFPIGNPLNLQVGGGFAVDIDGVKFNGYNFTVNSIREFTRHIGDQDFKFVDYILSGINTKTFAPQDAKTLRLRCVPNALGSQDPIILEMYDEMAFSQEFLDVVKDTTGPFEITDDDTKETTSYNRINGVEGSYEATVREVSVPNPQPEQIKVSQLEYWDYWRDASTGSHKEYVFVEMNSDNGWFQIWRGADYVL